MSTPAQALASQPKLRLVTDEIRTVKPTRSSVIMPVRGMDTYNSNPAVGLTADVLVAFYREAEYGRPLRQYDAFEKYGIEPDGHLRGLINGRIESVAGSDWVLKPGRPDKPSELAAAALEDVLRNATRSTTPALLSASQPATGGFRDFIEHHLTAPHFGIACTNIVWDLEGGYYIPDDLINAAHRRFASPSMERADEIWLVNDIGNALVALEPGLWAVSRYRNRNPWAAGLMRTCMWWAMFKRWSVRDWQVFAEMFGLPLAIGYYEEGAGEASRKALAEAVQMIGEDGYAVLSSLTELVIKDTARSGDSSTVFPKIAQMADEEMSKLIVGGTLNTDVAGVGSYNAATVHESRAYKLERADARRVEEMFTRDIGVPFTKWNGLDRAAPPRLKIQITRDNLERAQVLETLGVALDIDEDQIREEFSLRAPATGKGVRWPTKAAGAPAKPGKGAPADA
jgi:phage gp29-like protein